MELNKWLSFVFLFFRVIWKDAQAALLVHIAVGKLTKSVSDLSDWTIYIHSANRQRLQAVTNKHIYTYKHTCYISTNSRATCRIWQQLFQIDGPLLQSLQNWITHGYKVLLSLQTRVPALITNTETSCCQDYKTDSWI